MLALGYIYSLIKYHLVYIANYSIKRYRTLKSKNGLDKSRISNNYTLNKGHVYFFYNKGKYLFKRYQKIIIEMKKRGFQPDNKRKFPKDIFIENNLYKDWTPTLEDYKIIHERIKSKVKEKPNWYRKTIQ